MNLTSIDSQNSEVHNINAPTWISNKSLSSSRDTQNGTQDGFRYSDRVVPESRFYVLEARAASRAVSWTNLPVKSTMGFNLLDAGRLIRNINVCRAWAIPRRHGSCVISCDLLNYAAAESHHVLIIPRNGGVLKRRPWTSVDVRFNYFSREQPELLMFQKID